MTLRPAVAGDAGEMARLSGLLGYPATAAQIADRLEILSARAGACILVAARGDALLGWIAGEARLSLVAGEQFEITGLVVDPGTRRSGTGRSLVNALEARAAAMGIGSIVVRSNVKRSVSHPFYAALGYRRSKSQHVYIRTLERDARGTRTDQPRV